METLHFLIYVYGSMEYCNINTYGVKMKAFLSHNSFDKDFVEKVYQELGGAKAIFDVRSFENNSDLVHEIRHKMKEAGIYVLFLSKASLQSNWVKDEIDISHELKSNSLLKKFLIFQLDDTNWGSLDEWLRRYVVNSLPSPRAVASRIVSELNKLENTIDVGCLGREEDEKKITKYIWENERGVPPYIFISGPDGIGRKTLIKKVYSNLYSGILIGQATVSLDDYFDLSDLYRQLLVFSSNWRVSDYISKMNYFNDLADDDKIIEISVLIKTITVDYKQALIIDLLGSVYTTGDEVNPYLIKLMDSLLDYDYPYVIFLSRRGIPASVDSKGVYYALAQLGKADSEYLFNMLLHKSGVEIPSKVDKEVFIDSVAGHPGLINHVIAYLNKNPHYRPSKTSRSIIRLVREQLEKMVVDLIKNDVEPRKVLGLFGSANIISYEEVELIATKWPIFEVAFRTLLDSGFIIFNDGYYKLPYYLARLSSDYSEVYSSELLDIQKILLHSIDGIDDKDFVSLSLL
ncbi:TIR domain-containing protein, partial [Serratia fonticola]|nr:TIR domain-containing protein [Serratia fonticola]